MCKFNRFLSAMFWALNIALPLFLALLPSEIFRKILFKISYIYYFFLCFFYLLCHIFHDFMKNSKISFQLIYLPVFF